jgi:hypothetical protein
LISLDEALTRVNDHALPLEDARAQAEYGIPSAVDTIPIIKRAIAPWRVTVVLVGDSLGF